MEIGILFHELIHILDFCIFAGPAWCYWMYIFERLVHLRTTWFVAMHVTIADVFTTNALVCTCSLQVSYMIRQIHDRAKPEANLANNIALRMTVDDIIQTQQEAIQKDATGMSRKSCRLFQRVGVLFSEDDGAEPPPYNLANKISGVETKTVETLTADPEYSSTPGFSEMVAGSTPKTEFVLLPASYSTTVNGRTRKTVLAEPVLGYRDGRIDRVSGFAFREDNATVDAKNFATEATLVGKIQKFIISPDKVLLVLVRTWSIVKHHSRMKLIIVANGKNRIIRAEQLGPVVVFNPWTLDDGKAGIDRIDTTIECVILAREHPVQKSK